MEKKQSAYMHILRPIQAIGGERSKLVCDVLISICFLFFFICILFTYADQSAFQTGEGLHDPVADFFFSMTDTQIVFIGGGAVLMTVILGIVGRQLEPVKWNEPAFVIWACACLLIIISGCFHQIGEGYLQEQILVLLLMPLLYFVWQASGEIDLLYGLISWALVVLIIAAGIYMMICCPWEEGFLSEGAARYEGFMWNANRLGFFAAAGTVANLYLLFWFRRFWIVIPSVGMGFCISFIILSQCRSAAVAIVAAMITAGILYVKMGRPKKMILLAVAVMLAVCLINNAVIKRDIPEEQIPMSRLPSVMTVYAEDSDDQDGAAYEIPAGPEESILERLRGDTETGDYTSGRKDIWRAYYSRVNMAGHDVDYYLPMRVVDPDSGSVSYFRSAHNTLLEITFRSGLPAGILYLITVLYGMLYLAVKIFGRKEAVSCADAFACMAIVTFVLIGIVESIQNVFLRDITLLYYLGYGMVFTLKVPAFAEGGFGNKVKRLQKQPRK